MDCFKNPRIDCDIRKNVKIVFWKIVLNFSTTFKLNNLFLNYSFKKYIYNILHVLLHLALNYTNVIIFK